MSHFGTRQKLPNPNLGSLVRVTYTYKEYMGQIGFSLILKSVFLRKGRYMENVQQLVAQLLTQAMALDANPLPPKPVTVRFQESDKVTIVRTLQGKAAAAENDRKHKETVKYIKGHNHAQCGKKPCRTHGKWSHDWFYDNKRQDYEASTLGDKVHTIIQESDMDQRQVEKLLVQSDRLSRQSAFWADTGPDPTPDPAFSVVDPLPGQHKRKFTTEGLDGSSVREYEVLRMATSVRNMLYGMI